ncbi:MAG: hypothetical protein IJ685_11880 [Selenomonadaceae bacterium]|nr:hypothetical protein [Selenomonadaceae bacterium]
MQTKFFAVLFFSLMMIFSSASAKDIYASSNDGCDYYVMTETVDKREFTTNVSGKNYPVTEVTVNVKKIRAGELVAIQHWKFTSINYRTWQYSIDDTERGSFSSLKSMYAQKILETTGMW